METRLYTSYSRTGNILCLLVYIIHIISGDLLCRCRSLHQQSLYDNLISCLCLIFQDVPDKDVPGLLETNSGVPLHLVLFLRNERFSGIFVVGDSIVIKAPIDNVECGVFTLLSAYYVFNVDYPYEYAMALAIIQSLVLEPYTHKSSKRYAFLLKKLRKAMEETPDTSHDEDEFDEPPTKERKQTSKTKDAKTIKDSTTKNDTASTQ